MRDMGRGPTSSSSDPVSSHYEADYSSSSSDFTLGGLMRTDRGRGLTSSSADPVSLQVDADLMDSNEGLYVSCSYLSVTSEDKSLRQRINAQLKNNVVINIPPPSSETESSSDGRTSKSINNHSDDHTGNTQKYPNNLRLNAAHDDSSGNPSSSYEPGVNVSISQTEPAKENTKKADSEKSKTNSNGNLSSKAEDSKQRLSEKQQLKVHRPVVRIGPTRRETENSQSESEETQSKTFVPSLTDNTFNQALLPRPAREEQNRVLADRQTTNETADGESSDTQPMETERASLQAETEQEPPELSFSEGPVENVHSEISEVPARTVPCQEVAEPESTEIPINGASGHCREASATTPLLSPEADTQQRPSPRRSRSTLGRIRRRVAGVARFLSCSSPRNSREAT